MESCHLRPQVDRVLPAGLGGGALCPHEQLVHGSGTGSELPAASRQQLLYILGLVAEAAEHS